MIVSEMRDSVELTLRTGDYDASDIDRAFRSAANHMMLKKVDINRAEGTKTCTAYDNVIDFSSITDFRSNRLIAAEVGYNDLGEWADDLGAIAKNDLVQGDGDPDSYLYVCTTAHTAASDKEPPNTTYWKRVPNKQGTKLIKRDMEQVLHPPRPRRLRVPFGRHHLDNCPGIDPATHLVQPDRPVYIGFRTHTKAVVYPTPALAYPINIIYRKPFAMWTIGGSDASTIPVADEYLHVLIEYGTPAILEFPDPNERLSTYRWQLFEQAIRDIKAADDMSDPITVKTPNFSGF